MSASERERVRLATRRWREKQNAGRVIQLDSLLAACWCQQDYVLVPASEVREGRTGSCGTPRCREDAS